MASRKRTLSMEIVPWSLHFFRHGTQMVHSVQPHLPTGIMPEPFPKGPRQNTFKMRQSRHLILKGSSLPSGSLDVTPGMVLSPVTCISSQANHSLYHAHFWGKLNQKIAPRCHTQKARNITSFLLNSK